MDLMAFHSELDHDEDAKFVEAQLRSTIREDLSRAMHSRAPLLTHLNADTTWLLSIPVPQALPESEVTSNRRKRVTDSQKHGPEDRLIEEKNYFHILIDPWLRGSQSDVAQFFSQQWHASESAVQTIEELESRIAEIEELGTSPIRGQSPTSNSESKSRSRSAIDAVVVSHEFTDHMHKETLLEVPSSVPVFAASKAANAIRSWRHFDTVTSLPALESKNRDWRLTSLAPLPPWLGISKLGIDKTDLLYYHSAVLIAFSSHANEDDISGGQGETSSAQAVIYTPHGTTPSDIEAVATASPRIHTLALLHGLHDINLHAAQLNLGAHNGLKVQRMTRAKYWIGTHDEVKHGGGIVSWFLKRKVLSVREALERELEERSDEADAAVLDDVSFVELGNGESLLLE